MAARLDGVITCPEMPIIAVETTIAMQRRHPRLKPQDCH
jgi:hypothetical protein